MIRDSIFLSGWEYNRLLAPSPLVPMVSGLPAPILWQGAAHFWMFKNVYCTTESFEGDLAAYNDLGWTTGFIFSDLKRRGFLKTIDLHKEASSNEALKEDLLARHSQLQKDFSPEKLNALIDAGREPELERIKLLLLRPVLEQFRCVVNVSPNSLQAWTDTRATANTSRAANQALAYLEAPIIAEPFRVRASSTLCRPPGTGLSAAVLEAQRTVERTVQKPIISDLISGRLPQPDYHRALQSTKGVYAPIDQQLLADYKRNIGRLEDLRSHAETHLWKDLHSEWLPKLEENSAFLEEFRLLLRDALMQARFDPYLEAVSNFLIAFAGLAVGSVAGPTVGAATATGLALAHKRRRDVVKPYAMFYERAVKGAA